MFFLPEKELLNTEEQKIPGPKRIIGRKEAAEYFGVCVMTIDWWLKNEEIDHYKLGRSVRFDQEQLDRKLASSERKSR